MGDGFTALPHAGVPGLVFFTSHTARSAGATCARAKAGASRGPNSKTARRCVSSGTLPIASPPRSPTCCWRAQRLIRATERGAKAEFASPELAATERGGITAIAVSAKAKGTLWVGTSGKVWLTKNAGKAWKDLAADLKDAPAKFRVADLEAAHDDANTAWLAFDGHRSDDLAVHLFRTSNGGKTWKRIGQGIDRGPVLALQQANTIRR